MIQYFSAMSRHHQSIVKSHLILRDVLVNCRASFSCVRPLQLGIISATINMSHAPPVSAVPSTDPFSLFRLNTLAAFELWLLLHIESTKHVPVSLLFSCFICLPTEAEEKLCTHTAFAFPRHSRFTCVGVCVKIVLNNTKRFFQFFFSSKAEKLFLLRGRREKKILVFLSQHKTFRFNLRLPQSFS